MEFSESEELLESSEEPGVLVEGTGREGEGPTQQGGSLLLVRGEVNKG